MPTFALLIQWAEWTDSETHRIQEDSFSAENPQAALERLRLTRPFLWGLPWHFSGRSYKLLRLESSEVEVGEKFVPVARY